MEVQTKICKGILCKGISKAVTEFSPSSRICKKCNCEQTKLYYKNNDRAYRKFKNEIKSNSSCVKCGCTDIRLLEFDHTGEKNINICHSFSKSAIQSELKLVQVLCVWCHRLKTREALDKQMSEKSYTIVERPTDDNEGRKCNGLLCEGKLQFNHMFYPVKKSYCKICSNYKSRLIREENYNYLIELKLEHNECALCNLKVTQDTVTCFDFDHINTKTTTLSKLVRISNNNKEKMLKESQNCRLLCCKCHRIVTAKDFNYKYDVQSPIECLQAPSADISSRSQQVS